MSYRVSRYRSSSSSSSDSFDIYSVPILQTSPVLWSVDAGSDALSLHVGLKDQIVVGTKDGTGKCFFFLLFFDLCDNDI